MPQHGEQGSQKAVGAWCRRSRLVARRGQDVGVGVGQCGDRAFESPAMSGGAPHRRAGGLRPSQRLVTRPAHMLGWQGHGPDRPGKHRPNDLLTSVDALCHYEDLLICDRIKDLYRFSSGSGGRIWSLFTINTVALSARGSRILSRARRAHAGSGWCRSGSGWRPPWKSRCTRVGAKG